MTNVALACRLSETFPSTVKELVWMGGCQYAKGNVTLTSEFNINNDPEAAHIVLDSFPNSTMVRDRPSLRLVSASRSLFSSFETTLT